VPGNGFTTADFNYVLEHRIGTAKIGGKAAGCCWAIRSSNPPLRICQQIVLPAFYFLGANVIFMIFMAMNNVNSSPKITSRTEQMVGRISQEIQVQPGQALTTTRFPDGA